MHTDMTRNEEVVRLTYAGRRSGGRTSWIEEKLSYSHGKGGEESPEDWPKQGGKKGWRRKMGVGAVEQVKLYSV